MCNAAGSATGDPAECQGGFPFVGYWPANLSDLWMHYSNKFRCMNVVSNACSGSGFIFAILWLKLVSFMQARLGIVKLIVQHGCHFLDA